MNKISQVELYKTLIKPLGRSIEDHLKENPEKLVEYYIYHWLRFKEAFPGKSILSLVDTETVLLIVSFHFRFNNLRVKTLNKRIKEYKRKLAFEGKRAPECSFDGRTETEKKCPSSTWETVQVTKPSADYRC